MDWPELLLPNSVCIAVTTGINDPCQLIFLFLYRMKYTFLFLILFSLFSCQPRNPNAEKYGRGFDSVRAKIGLPVIDEDMVMQSSGADFAIFEKYGNAIPEFRTKSVFWGDSGMVLERNYFYGPNKQRLQIYYGYRIEGGWKDIGFGYGFNNDSVSVDLNKSQADSVLRSWHLEIR